MVAHGIPRRRFVQAVAGGGLGLASTGVASAGGRHRHFLAYLIGANQVPAVQTDARGLALFKLDPAGETLRYKLLVAKIEDVQMAHIHLGAAGENGPVVAWLYPEDGPPPQQIEGEFTGVLARGTVTADDLVGELEDESMDALVSAIEAGDAYVNVHTEANPDGEIRGQID